MPRVVLVSLLLTLCVPALSAQNTAEMPLNLSDVEEPRDEALLTPISLEAAGSPMAPQTPGYCYQACLSAQDSVSYCFVFPTPMVAQVQVTGPHNDAKMNDFTCVATCYGPTVTITGFQVCSF